MDIFSLIRWFQPKGTESVVQRKAYGMTIRRRFFKGEQWFSISIRNVGDDFDDHSALRLSIEEMRNLRDNLIEADLG